MILSLKKRSSHLPILLGLASMLMLHAPALPVPRDEPATAAWMKTPPAKYRMTAWWLWLGPAVTRSEILRELTEMHRAGLGGVAIYPCSPIEVDTPALGVTNLRFLSPQYLDVYHYALSTAKNLGMTVDLLGGTGWPFGGPSVSIDDASHALRMEKHALETGVPTQVASLTGDEKLLAVFLIAPGDSAFRDVTKFSTPDGKLSLPGHLDGEAMAIISAPTRQLVKHPSLGAEGYVLDHLSPQAFDHYAHNVLDRLVSGVPRGDPQTIFADSFEAYDSDWTAALPQEFLRRRGYDLQPYYPLLFQEKGPRSADIRFDYWETVADLFVDGFIRPLHEWAENHHLPSVVEAYGEPAVPQRSYAEADLPMGEDYAWKEFNPGRWTSSAAHFYRKPRVLAEYATWAGYPNRFTDTLDDLKLVADLQFLTGATELRAASITYSPPSAGIPGWQFYAGVDFGLNQSWWPFFPNLTQYAQRASYMLEQGRPVNDVLLCLPVEDVEARTPPGSLDTQLAVERDLAKPGDHVGEFGFRHDLTEEAPILGTLIRSGYSFDGISGDILQTRGVVDRSRLGVGDGTYAAIILPKLVGMRLGALERIKEFVRSGGTAIALGRLPERVYGGTAPERDSEQIRELIRDMFSAPAEPYSERSYGLGRGIFVTNESHLARALLRAVSPDLVLDKPDAEVGFVHRRASISATSVADYYFVVNTGSEKKNLRASFRIRERKPQIWDLESGNVMDPAAYVFQGERTSFDFSLGPRRSAVIYFGASHELSRVTASNLDEPFIENGIVGGIVSQPGKYFVQTASGRLEHTVTSVPDPLPVSGPWTLNFGKPLDISEQVSTLQSWTESPKTRYFSGTGEYSTRITIPSSYLGEGKVIWLDLGDVRYAARVWVNGQLAGDAWQPPYRLEISPWLKPGANTLKMNVANLLINCLLGQKPPDYSKAKTLDIRLPYPRDWEVNPEPWLAGLLGPVRLVPAVRLRFALHPQAAGATRPIP